MQPTAHDVDVLSVFPFLNDPAILADMKVELPSYLAKTADVCHGFDTLEWWRRNQQELPHWSSVAKKVLRLQPSSAAAAQRFFSNFIDFFQRSTTEQFGGLC